MTILLNVRLDDIVYIALNVMVGFKLRGELCVNCLLVYKCDSDKSRDNFSGDSLMCICDFLTSELLLYEIIRNVR